MKQTRIVTTALLAAFAVPLAASAESGPLGFGQADYAHPMQTDRPDFTEGTLTITPGHLQAELGYLFTYNEEDGFETEQHEGPSSLLRVGLLDDLELRLGWQGYIREEVREDATGIEKDFEGGGDMSVGFKHRMYAQGGLAPDLSTIVELGLPTGSDDVSSDDVEPALKLLWAYDLEDNVALGGNVNFVSPVEDHERFFQTEASLALGLGLTDQVGTYLEYFAFYPNQDAPDSTCDHFLNGGFTFLIDDNIQLDALVGLGINDDADDFFVGSGVSFRL